MGGRADVVKVAQSQIGVNWNNPRGENQIYEYFRTSTTNKKWGTDPAWGRAQAVQRSWCTYFAVWVLKSANIKPLPDMADKWGPWSVQRFLGTSYKGKGAYPDHSAKHYMPKPGDLFYKPINKHHIGIIESVEPDGYLWTINGDGEQEGHRELIMKYVPKLPPEAKKYGMGCVSRNKSKSNRFIGGDYDGFRFIEIPDA